MAHQPQQLVATAISTTEIALSWADVDTLEDETYDIERDSVVIEEGYAGDHSVLLPYTDTGLDPDTEYTYRVRASGGTEPFEPDADVSLSVVATTATIPTPTVEATVGLPTQPVVGAYAWWRADYIDGTTTLPADNTRVAQWNDVSGNNRHATQSTTADKPLFRTSIQNGLPVVRFAVSNTEIMTTGLTLAQPFTAIVVVNATAGATSRTVLGGSDTTTEIGITGADLWFAYAGGAVSDTSGAADASWRVMHAKVNGASSAVSRGDGSVTVGSTSTNTVTTLNIGGQSAGKFDGDIGEIIIYPSALSNADINTVATALATRWAATWTNI